MDESAAKTPEVAAPVASATPAPESPSGNQPAPQASPASEPKVEAPTPDASATPAPEASPRMEKRIRQLSAKLKEAKSEAPAPVATPNQFIPSPLPSLAIGEGDYTPDELNARIAQAGQSIAQIEIAKFKNEVAAEKQQQQIERQFDDDLRHVETKYEALNEDSPNYDPKLATEITELYEEAFRSNPNARLAPIVDRVMRLAGYSADKSAAHAAEVVAQQKANGALAPGTTAAKSSQTFTREQIAKMSTEEYMANRDAIKAARMRGEIE